VSEWINILLQFISILVLPLIAWYHKVQQQQFSAYQRQVDLILSKQEEILNNAIAVHSQNISGMFNTLRDELSGINSRVHKMETNFHALEIRFNEKFVSKEVFVDLTREMGRVNQQLADLRVENQKAQTGYVEKMALCQQNNGCNKDGR
jgi:hypothetical protein